MDNEWRAGNAARENDREREHQEALLNSRRLPRRSNSEVRKSYLMHRGAISIMAADFARRDLPLADRAWTLWTTVRRTLEIQVAYMDNETDLAALKNANLK